MSVNVDSIKKQKAKTHFTLLLWSNWHLIDENRQPRQGLPRRLKEQEFEKTSSELAFYQIDLGFKVAAKVHKNMFTENVTLLQ